MNTNELIKTRTGVPREENIINFKLKTNSREKF